MTTTFTPPKAWELLDSEPDDGRWFWWTGRVHVGLKELEGRWHFEVSDPDGESTGAAFDVLADPENIPFALKWIATEEGWVDGREEVTP